MNTRPEHLPDFSSPPLDEVVVGVQFTPPQRYSTVYTKDVWELFKDNYPSVQEHPLLEPSFETFGGSSPQSGLNFQFGLAPIRNRLWFIPNDHNHLIQFQDDRFLLNWRKRQNDQEYPHFESIAQSFEEYLNTLQNFFINSFECQLDINQAEVSYINIIPEADYSLVGEWFKFFNLRNVDLEAVKLNFTEVIKDPEGKPYARLVHELQSVITRDGKMRALRLSLTFRGKPAGAKIPEAIAFAYLGREKIVTRFKELTTKKAHNSWEIKQ